MRPFVQHSAATVSAVDDHVLLGQVRAGDMAAFEVLFHRYYRPLRAFAHGLVGSVAAADDCVQDVLFRLWAERERWHVQGDVRQYLYATVRNHALNVLKRERVVARWESRATQEVSHSGMSQGPASADDTVRERELAEALEAAVMQLPERRREAFRLRMQHQLSNAAIAQVMGISIKNVERHLMLALRAVRASVSNVL